MKKFCISFVIILIIVLLIGVGGGQTKTEYLRIHIRANSNGESDQAVKLKVKDEVVNYLAPHIAECNSKNEAIAMLNRETKNINRVIDLFLEKEGFLYTANTVIREEKFPTRVYDEVTLEAGYYDSVIIELGEAKGDNWWCVVYPPLCFTGTNIKYRSKVYDIISDFYKDKIKEEK